MEWDRDDNGMPFGQDEEEELSDMTVAPVHKVVVQKTQVKLLGTHVMPSGLTQSVFSVLITLTVDGRPQVIMRMGARPGDLVADTVHRIELNDEVDWKMNAQDERLTYRPNPNDE